ncbi:MAG: TolC family protein, partial [Planctomycetota bacterium]
MSISHAWMHRGAWVGLIALAACLGCKSPCANPFRTFHCVPNTADHSAPGFWETCGAPTKVASEEPGVFNLASHQQSAEQGPLRLPPELPGADTEPLVVPSMRDLDAPQQRETIRRIFPELRPSETNLDAVPEAIEPRLTLESLHTLAHQNHPSLRSAAAAVESARGLMIQAGLPPNPKVGFQGDTINTAYTGGYQGAYLTQTIITARKLGLAAEAAAVDYANAVIAQRKIWVQVTSRIRRAYFQVLASRERVRLANALFHLASRAYDAQVELVAAGEAAPYEPLQLRVLTTQARASLVRAQQDAIAAWRSLAAATGVPDYQVSAIEGSIDCAVPSISYEEA